MNEGMKEFRTGWRIQFRTIHALMVRDLVMRYGRGNIGFGWTILEPMLLTLGVMVIWTVMGGHEKSGATAVEMVLTGYMPLTLWRHLTGPVISMFRNSSSLLYHRRITLFDLFFSRQLLETIGTTAAFVVIYTTLFLLGMIKGTHDWGLLILGWLMMIWIGAAFGAILAALTEKYDVADHFIQPLQYLNIPLSGAFFMVDWLPYWAQQAIMWHPLVHVYEVFRSGYFGPMFVTHYDYWYYAAWAFSLSFIGLGAIYRVRSHVRLQ